MADPIVIIEDRPVDYDEETEYKESTQTWVDPFQTGGGRYQERLIAVSHRKIYYEAY